MGLNNKGVTLIELLLSVGLSGFAFAVGSRVITDFSKQTRVIVETQTIKDTVSELRFQLESPDNIRVMIDQGPPENLVATACLRDGTPCNKTWQDIRLVEIRRDPQTGVFTPPANPELAGSWNPFDFQEVYDPFSAAPSRGIDPNGSYCTGFSSSCPFRIVAQWKPSCNQTGGVDCILPKSFSTRLKLDVYPAYKKKFSKNLRKFEVQYTHLYETVTLPSMAVYEQTVCVKRSNKTVMCWGDNRMGDLGRGVSVAYSPVPDYVRNFAGTGPLLGVEKVIAANQTWCALLDGSHNNRVTCWGENTHGAVGIGMPSTDFGGSVADYLTKPVGYVRGVSGIGFLSNVEDIFPGEHSVCALSAGEIYCWGELGYESTLAAKPHDGVTMIKTASLPPTAPYAQFRTSFYNLVGCTPGGKGSWPCQDDAYMDLAPYPTLISRSFTAAEIASDYLDSVWAGHIPHHDTTTGAPYNSNWDQFFRSAKINCFLYSGQLSCWGNNQFGGLAVDRSTLPIGSQDRNIGMNTSHFIPGIGVLADGSGLPGGPVTSATRLSNVSVLAEGGEGTQCAIMTGADNKRIACWGSTYSQWAGYVAGIAPDYSVPGGMLARNSEVTGAPLLLNNAAPGYVLLSGGASLTDVKRAVLGWKGACAIREDGDVYCWGSNEFGSLGNGTNGGNGSGRSIQDFASRVNLPEPAVEIGVGNWFGCALASSEKVYCWGLAANGSLGHLAGNPSVARSGAFPNPIEVEGL